MATQNVRGTSAALLQSRTEDFDPTRGLIISIDVRGINAAQVVSMRDDYTRQGVANRLTYRQGNITELVVEDSTQPPQDQWEIVGTEIELDLLLHPSILPFLSNNDVRILRQLFNDEHINWTDFVASSDYTTGLSATAKAHASTIQALYNLKLSGVDGYRRQQYVIQHTTNVASNYSANIADVGIDKIYSPAQILTECQSAALWTNPIPDRLSYKIAHIPQTPSSTPSGYTWGWLKSASTETKSPYNRVQIKTEFTLEMWSTTLYGLYTP